MPRDGQAVPRISLSRPLLVLGALAAIAYLIENAWQSWGAIQLHSTVGASLRLAALAPAAFALAAAVARLSAHRLARGVKPAMLPAAAAAAAAGSAVAALGHTPHLGAGRNRACGPGYQCLRTDPDRPRRPSASRPARRCNRHGHHTRLSRIRPRSSSGRTRGRRRDVTHCAARSRRTRLGAMIRTCGRLRFG